MKILQVALGVQTDIRDAFQKIGDVIYWDWSGHDRTFNQDIRALVDKHNPDLIWLQIQTHGIISVDTAKYIASKAKVVNWTGDVRLNNDWFIQIGKHIHLTLFTNMHDVEQMRRNGVRSEYLQIGFPEYIFTPIGEAKECPEIIYMANYTAGFPLSDYRKQMVNFLKEKFRNRFAVYGNSWGFGQHYIPDQHEEAKHYRGCKIAINLSHFNYSRYSSDRLFRLMGAGAFCLSHNYVDIEKEFEIKKHLDVWSDFEELEHKIHYYLETKDEIQNRFVRHKIAEEGCKYVHANCTWTKRIEQLKQML